MTRQEWALALGFGIGGAFLLWAASTLLILAMQ